MNVCRRISFRLYFWKWTPNFGLVSLLVIDILSKPLRSFVAYWPHAHQEHLWHGAAKYVSNWGVKNIQNWRDCSRGSADLFVPFSLDSYRHKRITNDSKTATVPERRNPYIPLPHPWCLSAPSRWRFWTGKQSLLPCLPSSRKQIRNASPCHRLPGSGWQMVSSLPWYTVTCPALKLLCALMICYNWLTDGNNFMALWLVSSTVCWFFWWSDLTSLMVLLCAAESLWAGGSPVVKVWALPAACTKIAALPYFWQWKWSDKTSLLLSGMSGAGPCWYYIAG